MEPSKFRKLIELIFNKGALQIIGDKPYDIQVHDERVYRRILTQRNQPWQIVFTPKRQPGGFSYLR